MVVTVLAIGFLIIIGFITVFGYKTIIRKPVGEPGGENMEKCAICRKSLGRKEMVERQIGDYKLLYFCETCIRGLHEELQGGNLKHQITNLK